MKEKVLILYSGGADSRLMVHMAQQSQMEIHCLLIDYGQLHVDELDYAEMQLRRIKEDQYDLTWSRVRVGGLELDSALTGSGRQGRFGNEEDISIWHVPGRNTMFAGIALSVAENLGCNVVWIGADFSDRLGNFIDCAQDFVVTMDLLYSYGASYEIRFEAPLMGMTKEFIKNLLKQLGLDADIYSGYGHIREHSCKGENCGSCGI